MHEEQVTIHKGLSPATACSKCSVNAGCYHSVLVTEPGQWARARRAGTRALGSDHHGGNPLLGVHTKKLLNLSVPQFLISKRRCVMCR